jgi:2-polyprenyl-3-methyl-5-hydroxy-6-metoxy-1,4-benzoquinol methylase
MEKEHAVWNEGTELLGDKRIARWCPAYVGGSRFQKDSAGELLDDAGHSARRDAVGARRFALWDEVTELLGDKRIARWCQPHGVGSGFPQEAEARVLDDAATPAPVGVVETRQHAVWDEVTELLGNRQITLGKHLANWFRHTPRRALHYSSYYKFAAKMVGRNKRVLDVGCREGLGTWMLATECGFARGIDPDEEAIALAERNWPEHKVDFLCTDFVESPPGQWDAVVSFDVIEHVQPESAGRFFERMTANLTRDGVVVVGTQNQTGQVDASARSRPEQVNVYSAERLEEEMRRRFAHVFMFGANDEVVHTGFPPMTHYLIALGCKKLG